MPSGVTHCPYCLAHKPVLSARLVGYQVVCRNCLATGPGKRFKKQALNAWREQASTQRGARPGRPTALPGSQSLANGKPSTVEPSRRSLPQVSLRKR